MISRTGLHAVRAMIALGALPEGVYEGAGALARSIGAPQTYLAKLLQLFAKEGIVESQRGLGGGFRLARIPREISLLAILDPIDRPSRWGGCFLGNPTCEDERACAIHDRWAGVRDAYLRFLADTTLEDLMEERVEAEAHAKRGARKGPRSASASSRRKGIRGGRDSAH